MLQLIHFIAILIILKAHFPSITNRSDIMMIIYCRDVYTLCERERRDQRIVLDGYSCVILRSPLLCATADL